MKFFCLVLFSLVSIDSYAGEVELDSPEERKQYIRRSYVWKKPTWLDPNLSFDPEFDLRTDLETADPLEDLLKKDQVVCQLES